MRLAIVLDPLPQIKTYKDTTYAIMRAAAARGHHLFVMMQEDLALHHGVVIGQAQALHFRDDPEAWYALDAPITLPLREFDVVLMRKDPPFDMEYVASTYLLELAVAQGARVLNDPRAIRDHNEKIAIARFPQFIAPSLVTRRMDLIRDFIAEHQDIIVKPLNAMGGSGIFRVSKNDPNLNVILETCTALGTQSVMAQQYIPEIAQGDKRILIIDGQVLPHALARIPKPGETRGNLAVGGTGVVRPLSARDREIAETLSPTLKEAGLFFVGLDVIGNYLTEINVTSPTGVQEISAQSGMDVAGLFVDALEHNV